MSSYAQTNVQLINQLLHRGYSNEEIVIVIKAYDLSISIFTGQYQRSGRTQIAHGVVTASVLVSLRLPINLVAAGLIHNAYKVGDFGDSQMGASESRRKYVRNSVGRKVEEYAYKFFASRRKMQILYTMHENIDSLSEFDTHILLLILADQLDHHVNLSRIYHQRDTKKTRDFINRNGHIMIEVSKKLGYNTLASELSRAFRETLSAKIPQELLDHFNLDRHSTIAPKSYQKRPELTYCE